MSAWLTGYALVALVVAGVLASRIPGFHARTGRYDIPLLGLIALWLLWTAFWPVALWRVVWRAAREEERDDTRGV